MNMNFYDVLGVSKSQSDQEIKQQYKKLVKQYHPDTQKNQNKEEQERKFKEIAEQYEVLSDKDKRKNYDSFGSETNPFGNTSQQSGSGSMFNDFFQGFFGNSRNPFEDIGFFNTQANMGFGGNQQKVRGSDIRLKFTLSLKDTLTDKTTNIEYKKAKKCSHCQGTGAKDGKTKICELCHGFGVIQTKKQIPMGNVIVSETCPKCKGKGNIIETNCSYCHGTGFETTLEKIEITIPRGTKNGMTLTVRGGGNEQDINGDLHIDIQVQIPNEFELIDSNIHTTKKISYLEAILGTTIDVKTLDDTMAKLKIPNGTQPEQTFIIRGKGVPQFQSNNIGDMYVKIQVEIPKVISEKEKKLLEEVKNEKQK